MFAQKRGFILYLLQRWLKIVVLHQEGVCRLKGTKAICTLACSLRQVPALGVNRKRFSRRVKNERMSEQEDGCTQPVSLLWSYLAECWLLRAAEVGEHGLRRGGERNAAAEQLRREPAASPAMATRAGQVMGRRSHASGLEEPGLLFWLGGCSRQLWRQGGSHVPWPHYRSGLNSFSYFICQIIWALWKLNPVCIFLVSVLAYYTPWNLTQMLPLCKNYHSIFKMGKIQPFNIFIGKKKKKNLSWVACAFYMQWCAVVL